MTPEEKHITEHKEPWWPPLIIDFLDSVLTLNMTVFEFGSGVSSLWLADRVEHVTSVEHDSVWSSLVHERAPTNLNLIPAPLPYHDRIDMEGRDTKYDLIVVDGRGRVQCVLAAMKHLKDGGFMLLDDSHRSHYHKAVIEMQKHDWPMLTGTMFKDAQGYNQECLVVKKA